jgi:hypothetical protein
MFLYREDRENDFIRRRAFLKAFLGGRQVRCDETMARENAINERLRIGANRPQLEGNDFA